MKSNTSHSARRTEAIARLAAQLCREDSGLYKTLQELADDATALVDAGINARKAIERGRAYADARKVTDKYHADVIPQGDQDGLVLGIKFRSGRFTSGARNIFFVW